MFSILEAIAFPTLYPTWDSTLCILLTASKTSADDVENERHCFYSPDQVVIDTRRIQIPTSTRNGAPKSSTGEKLRGIPRISNYYAPIIFNISSYYSVHKGMSVLPRLLCRRMTSIEQYSETTPTTNPPLTARPTLVATRKKRPIAH